MVLPHDTEEVESEESQDCEPDELPEKHDADGTRNTAAIQIKTVAPVQNSLLRHNSPDDVDDSESGNSEVNAEGLIAVVQGQASFWSVVAASHFAKGEEGWEQRDDRDHCNHPGPWDEEGEEIEDAFDDPPNAEDSETSPCGTATAANRVVYLHMRLNLHRLN